MAKKNAKITFEEKVNRLDEISSMLEADEIGLEEAIKLYEEGINLSKECMNDLKSAELKITRLKSKVEDIAPEEDLFEEKQDGVE